MPRNPSGIYTKPFPDVVSGTTIESTEHNGTVSDIEYDLNQARPIIAGGTGSTTAAGARTNLQAERAMQEVTNYANHAFEAGSFWSKGSASDGPSANFCTGTAHIVTDAGVTTTVLEAHDVTTDKTWYRRRVSPAAWGAWTDAGAPGDFVKKTGDTMSGQLHVGIAGSGGVKVMGQRTGITVGTGIELDTSGGTNRLLSFGPDNATAAPLTISLRSANESVMINSITATTNSRIGLFNTNPQSLLDVGTPPTGAYTSGAAANFSIPSDTLFGVTIHRGGVTSPQALVLGVNNATPYSEIQSIKASVGFNNLVLQRQGGNVGIATTAPTAPLTVGSSTVGGGIDLDAPASGTAGGARIRYNAGGTFNSGIGAYSALLGGAYNADLVFLGPTMRFWPGGGTEKVTFHTTGNVGIGAISPNAKLEVVGAGVAGTPLELLRVANSEGGYTSSASGTRITFYYNTSSILGAITSYATAGNGSVSDMVFAVRSGEALTDRVRIQAAGNLIPSTDNTATLGASGARWSQVWAGNGTIQTSDERLKQDIADDTMGLEFIKRVRPIIFREKGEVERDGETAPVRSGVSAQQVINEALGGKPWSGVVYDKDNDRYGVNYAAFTTPLIAAVQALAARIETLENA